MIRLSASVPLLALAALLVSCGGGGPTGTDGDGGGGMNGPMMSRQVKSDPSFADIQDILERRGCTGPSCHASGQGELFLFPSEPETNHDNLVNEPSSQEPGLLLVEPGNVMDSYVVVKLEGRQTVGDLMPPGGPALDSIDMTNFKNWIANGAVSPQ